jgi:hypothetical protein
MNLSSASYDHVPVRTILASLAAGCVVLLAAGVFARSQMKHLPPRPVVVCTPPVAVAALVPVAVPVASSEPPPVPRVTVHRVHHGVPKAPNLSSPLIDLKHCKDDPLCGIPDGSTR